MGDEPARDLTQRELITEIGSMVRAHLREEIEAAKRELRADMRGEIAAAGWLGVATVCALATFFMMLVTLTFVWALSIPGWLAALLIGVIMLGFGAVAGAYGWSRRVRSPIRHAGRDDDELDWSRDRLH
jgi:hypothetical protein